MDYLDKAYNLLHTGQIKVSDVLPADLAGEYEYLRDQAPDISQYRHRRFMLYSEAADRLAGMLKRNPKDWKKLTSPSY